jgi:Na+-driven multidrug efflux pump
MLFAAGMTAFAAIVSRVGTSAQAASAVLMNITLVAILPGLGFGLAATSLVGQALGRGDADDARRWGWDVTRMAMVGVTLISLPAMLFPDLCLRPFLQNPETRALAETPLRLVALSLPLDTAGVVLLNALFGAGDMRRAILISTGMQYFVQLPLIWLVAVPLHQGMMTIWAVQTAYRLSQAALFAMAWRRGRWAHARL